MFWLPVLQLEVPVGADGHLRMVSLPPKRMSGGSGAVLGCWGFREHLSHKLSLLQEELRPRLCHIKKGPNGYGFNLHSDKSRPGQYVRAIDPDSPAEAAGLAPQDRIIEVCQGRGGLLAGWGRGGASPRKTLVLPCIPVPRRELPFAGTVRGVPGTGSDSRCGRPTRSSPLVPTQGCSHAGGGSSTAEGWG